MLSHCALTKLCYGFTQAIWISKIELISSEKMQSSILCSMEDQFKYAKPLRVELVVHIGLYICV